MKSGIIFLLLLLSKAYGLSAQNTFVAKGSTPGEENENAVPYRVMEKLNRGLVAINQNDSSVYIGWSLLGTEPD